MTGRGTTTCYFLLNYARGETVTDCWGRHQPTCYFLLNYAQKTVEKLAVCRQLGTCLLFSFELCLHSLACARASGGRGRLAIFFWILLQSTLSRRHVQLPRCLAIFFWILLIDPIVPGGRTSNLYTCYFLLNFGCGLCFVFLLDLVFRIVLLLFICSLLPVHHRVYNLCSCWRA